MEHKPPAAQSCARRAGCRETCTSGSENGMMKPTSAMRHGASSRFYHAGFPGIFKTGRRPCRRQLNAQRIEAFGRDRPRARFTKAWSRAQSNDWKRDAPDTYTPTTITEHSEKDELQESQKLLFLIIRSNHRSSASGISKRFGTNANRFMLFRIQTNRATCQVRFADVPSELFTIRIRST